MSGVALVLPTCRKDSLRDFLAAWGPVRFWDEDKLIIVEDDTPSERLSSHHHGHPEIAADLGDDAWIISRRDSAIRSYGFLVAWRLGADVTMTLDDDTRPIPGVDHLAGHRAAFEETSRWVSSVPGLRVRGLPYCNVGRLADVMISVGLWRGVPDLDAPTSLVSGVPADFEPPAGRCIVPHGQYFPMCGMNLACRREALPLLYFGLHGDGWPYRRFDDIWAGVIAKKICDHLGWSISVGEPHVRHERASDPFVNIVKEAPGIASNERFWEVVDSVPLAATTAAGCMAEMGRGLARAGDDYLASLGRATGIWAGLFGGGDPSPSRSTP
jgi:reversibly glycosylated polypeptide / UDP-arabinopyranose mutase